MKAIYKTKIFHGLWVEVYQVKPSEVDDVDIAEAPNARRFYTTTAMFDLPCGEGEVQVFTNKRKAISTANQWVTDARRALADGTCQCSDCYGAREHTKGSPS